MLEKIGPVKNPLTIIAIFAGIVEVSSTLVLPHISSDLQGTYIWFLMLFPSGLVGAFFLILYYKHFVLYAPSDYKDEKAFMKFCGEEDYEENKDLSVANAVKENIVSATSEIIEDTKIISQIAESVSDKVGNYASSYDSKSLRRNYIKGATSFESQIRYMLRDLGIPYKRAENGSCFDISATKRDGSSILIEVKYYQAPLRGENMVLRLAGYITACMASIVKI